MILEVPSEISAGGQRLNEHDTKREKKRENRTFSFVLIGRVRLLDQDPLVEFPQLLNQFVFRSLRRRVLRFPVSLNALRKLVRSRQPLRELLLLHRFLAILSTLLLLLVELFADLLAFERDEVLFVIVDPILLQVGLFLEFFLVHLGFLGNGEKSLAKLHALILHATDLGRPQNRVRIESKREETRYSAGSLCHPSSPSRPNDPSKHSFDGYKEQRRVGSHGCTRGSCRRSRRLSECS